MNKNKISKEEVLHLAELVKLHLSEDEIKKLSEQFGETLDYVKNMDELDTSKVKPTSQTTSLENVFFEDGEKNKRGLSQEEALINSKKKDKGMFVVGRIM